MIKATSKARLFLQFFGRITICIFALIFTWVFTNLFDNKKEAGDGFTEKGLRSGLLKGKEAKADAPAPPSGKGFSTPFLAYYDGEKFRLENDIMFGRPKSYWPTYETAKMLYEDGRISPDLYKIAAPTKAFDGKLKFQIQEIELEESYVKWVELSRVLHPFGTEVVVDSEYKKFYVLPKLSFRRNVAVPASVTKDGIELSQKVNDVSSMTDPAHPAEGVLFDAHSHVDVRFTNLDHGKAPFLIIKSWFRDWVLGLEEDWENRVQNSSVSQWSFWKLSVGRALILLIAWFAVRRGGANAMALLSPFIMGGGGCSGASSSDDCGCSFVYEYKNGDGDYIPVTVSEPRAWKYNTEIIEFPRESVLPDGTLALRIHSSKRHMIGFIGISQAIPRLNNASYTIERLDLARAEHSRFGDVRTELTRKDGKFVQTIPGDTINLDFEAPQIPNKSQGTNETYLIRSSGFYTALRPSNRVFMGDWQRNLSPEARSRLNTVVPLARYR